MIYKVIYQPDQKQVPQRETSESLYVEAESIVEVRRMVTQHTDYVIEFIQELTGKHLEYEQQQEDFELTEFSNED
ncbi:DNA-directed RNA polymerase subunit epsilon [Atopobacter phocae]|uniref:DNA-directed RNA polymerase subunit epsilon n=1 Tax=Atopobacter phocae TaxID=136492 RepID=UPI00047152E3|nr:DNA-directed RNA polymerase subunit epsilon [Atopobacter phocae]